MINSTKLYTELSHLQIVSVSPVNQKHSSTKATFHNKDNTIVRVVWINEPTPKDFDSADRIIQVHDGTPTVTDVIQQMDTVQLLMLKLSIRWHTLSQTEQSLVDSIIDQHVSNTLTGI